MADQPLSSATDPRLGGLLSHQLTNPPQVHPLAKLESSLSIQRLVSKYQYPVLAKVSLRYPGLRGRFPTCYSPVRH